jgi:Tol biopolymer transport system component
VEEHPSPSFWTVPIAGGPAVESEIPSDIAGQFELAASGTETLGGGPGWIVDSDFVWAPSGTAIYFERTFRGTRNLWKMRVNPDTLAAVAIERLTAGPGPDTGISISRDGKMLAFTGESENVGAMLFPFDGTRRVITARGEMATPPGVEAWRFSLSHDGKKLAFMGTRAGKCELWVKSIANGGETQIGNDQYCRGYSQWSPDGLLLAYRRFKRVKSSPKTEYEHQVMMWSLQRHAEEPLTDAGVGWRGVNGWSPDGKSILVRKKSGNSDSDSVWNMRVAAAPHAGAAAQNINFGPAYNSYFEQMYSPDGKWIIFEAVRKPPQVESTLYVIPATGGAWIRITDGKQWDDKPRFSPDGKTIYFVSGRGGFYNVWGIRFNPSSGHPVGGPFRLTAFEGPALNVPNRIDLVDLAVDQTKLVLTMSEVSGGIWVLDKVAD